MDFSLGFFRDFCGIEMSLAGISLVLAVASSGIDEV